MEYNIYCDESCHLEKECQESMVLGAVWCPKDNKEYISQRIREIKAKYGFKTGYAGFGIVPVRGVKRT